MNENVSAPRRNLWPVSAVAARHGRRRTARLPAVRRVPGRRPDVRRLRRRARRRRGLLDRYRGGRRRRLRGPLRGRRPDAVRVRRHGKLCAPDHAQGPRHVVHHEAACVHPAQDRSPRPRCSHRLRRPREDARTAAVQRGVASPRRTRWTRSSRSCP
ncbi:hypothetical protein ETD83_00590 [Actinomadura soli]|uniref:Uncharacterized protein n=1 Tax=Actinomadura soli TaxID=2508997 RepID=A0A5C4JK63_9ACTN|nr:hypothetical protein ETD83_00590 [Actinomadura soli]